MASFEIRPANSNDFPHLIAIDHTCSSNYVWQLELRSESKRVTADFHEVRLPRAITVAYPRNPSSLVDAWTKRDVLLVALQEELPVGYISGVDDPISGSARIMDLAVALAVRRQGVASALLSGIQVWAAERGVRRIVLETQSKNHPYIRLAQKYGYEFCGYNVQYYPTQDVALFFGRALK